MKNKDTKVEIAITINGKQHFVSAQEARQIFHDLQSVFSPIALLPSLTTSSTSTSPFDPSKAIRYRAHTGDPVPQLTYTTSS